MADGDVDAKRNSDGQYFIGVEVTGLKSLPIALAFWAAMLPDPTHAGFAPIPSCKYIAGEIKEKIRALQDGYTYDDMVFGYMGQQALRFKNQEGNSIDLYSIDAFIILKTYSPENLYKNFGPEFIDKLRKLYENNKHDVNVRLRDIGVCYTL